MSGDPIVLVLHGPSGVGKDSVIDLLRARTGIHRVTSTTSRERRPGELDGVEYHFISRAAFERKLRYGEFAEWAPVYGAFYGVERKELLGPLEHGQDAIIRTDVQGARTWRRILEGAVSIFLMAEDREALRARLIRRGSESAESLGKRMAELEVELEDMPNNDYVVINRHGAVEAAVAEIEEIMARERANPARPRPRLKA